MSAIAGIFNLDGQPVKAAFLEGMVDTLAHCGTDGRGVWLDGCIALGHCARWTTPEAVQEMLPLTLGGRVVITGDVRLDNREDLLRSLSEGNGPGVSTPDCALVGAAYEKWGESCVEHLLGDFAFAIWDKRAHRLFCARDHMGVKPFYYAIIPGRQFVFATEIKAILSVPGVRDTINDEMVADGFVHHINDHTSTYYTEVSRLRAAHCLAVGNVVSTRRYWKLDPDRELRLNSDREYADGFHEHFSRAVQCRLRSSHRIGSMLSGGLDSSSVSCVARDWLRAHGQPKLHTFSGVFDEFTECDERPYIKTVLQQGHCEPSFIVADSLSPLSYAQAITWHLDKPIAAANLYFVWHAYRRAKELGVKVILDGFDGDTTVSHGVSRLRELAQARKWGALNSQLYHGLRVMGAGFCWRWIWNHHPALRPANRYWGGAMRRLRRARMAKTGASDPMEVLNPDLARKLGFLDKAQKPGMAFTSERSRHCQLLERSVLLDGVEMLAHSAAASEVEVRFPFMDVRLIEYCLSLPSNQKFRDGYTRFVMHNGMAGVLPDKIKRRPGKSNLTPSFGKGLLKFERDNLRMIILSEASQLTAFVNLERIKACLDRFQRGTGSPNDITAVWNTVGLAMWLRARHAGAK